MKEYFSTSVFPYSWKDVATAFWNRYPNPYSTHVLSEDTIEQKIIKGKLFTRRLLTKTNKLPSWAEHFVPGKKQVFIIEDSIIDPKKKTITTTTENLHMQNILRVKEQCVYTSLRTKSQPTSHSDSKKKHQPFSVASYTRSREIALCSRTAWISSPIFGISRAIESFAFERYKQNAKKNISGFLHTLRSMFGEAISLISQDLSKISDSNNLDINILQTARNHLSQNTKETLKGGKEKMQMVASKAKLKADEVKEQYKGKRKEMKTALSNASENAAAAARRRHNMTDH